jgi:hypothetical protein
MPQVAKWVNTDLSKGFPVPQVAQKHGWPESLVWSQALVKADDFDRFKALQWGIRTWDVWHFMECDPRFGDDWPGRIPAQLVAHILYFFSEPGDLVRGSGTKMGHPAVFQYQGKARPDHLRSSLF